VDTSGSIGTEILRQVAGEISAIVQDCRPSCTQVVYCDYDVTHTETFAPEDQVQIHPKGGGGTRFKPVFDWVADNSEEPVVAMIYITDTYGNFGELEEPPYPVIWGLTEPVNNFVPPFGRTVHVYE
jgi:predicted metal-dependent peptidase